MPSHVSSEAADAHEQREGDGAVATSHGVERAVELEVMFGLRGRDGAVWAHAQEGASPAAHDPSGED